jgi:hypothetical protein
MFQPSGNLGTEVVVVIVTDNSLTKVLFSEKITECSVVFRPY